EDGKKTFEQVVIPLKEGGVEFPLVRFSYFDILTEKYVTLTRGPFQLEIDPQDPGQGFRAVEFQEGTGGVVHEDLGRDLVFIKERPGRWVRIRNGGFGGLGFYLLIFLYLNLWGAAVGYLLYRRKRTEAPGLFRRSRAFQEALRALKGVEPSDPRTFYDDLTRVLREYLEARFALSPGQVEVERILDMLGAARHSDGTAERLQDLWGTAERVRFAGEDVSLEKMVADREAARTLITTMERKGV
ncbi:MAG: protein BatD, partial [Elusimicrobia bacterium]|nr:protein BatD [Elusimicrobiota bacterium]